MNPQAAMPSVALARPWRAQKALRDFCLAAVDRAAGEAGGVVRFAQVGANDGQLADPIRPFIESGRWQGVMIEPHPTYYAELCALHSGRGGIRMVNCAISDRPGQMDLHYLAEDRRDAYPAWARGCASLKPNRLAEVLEGHRKDGGPVEPARDIAAVTVPVRPLGDVLAQSGLDALDILVVDVEGFELEVLGSADLAGLDLRAALVECNGSDIKNESQVADILARAGLVTFRLRDDLFAVHPDRVKVPLAQMMRFLGQPPLGSAPLADPVT